MAKKTGRGVAWEYITNSFLFNLGVNSNATYVWFLIPNSNSKGHKSVPPPDKKKRLFLFKTVFTTRNIQLPTSPSENKTKLKFFLSKNIIGREW